MLKLAKNLFLCTIILQGILLVASFGESIPHSEINNKYCETDHTTYYQMISWITNYFSKAFEKLSPLFILYGAAALIGFTKKLFNDASLRKKSNSQRNDDEY